MKVFFSIFHKAQAIFTGSTYGSSFYELSNFMCGIGESKILENKIHITKYPFKPSVAHPKNIFHARAIEAICLDSFPPFIKVENDCIFISKEYSEALKNFAVRNEIETMDTSSNWVWILEPFLDTEFSEKEKQRNYELLAGNGFTRKEVDAIRTEVGAQMMKYNFDTRLWEWQFLGLTDVLAAMRVKYTKRQFEEFYKRAMEIQWRK